MPARTGHPHLLGRDAADWFSRRDRPGQLAKNLFVGRSAGMSSFKNSIVMDVKNIAEVPAFTTKDGSEIRELLAHRNSSIRHQSLAEARVPVGGSTLEHYHPKTEEIYY